MKTWCLGYYLFINQLIVIDVNFKITGHEHMIERVTLLHSRAAVYLRPSGRHLFMFLRTGY